MAYRFMRHPRTTQELRANEDRNDPLIRNKRRNLPTARDDIFIKKEKSWKRTREHQWREDSEHYAWHEFHYDYWNTEERLIARNLYDFIDMKDCCYEYRRGKIIWFGPEFFWK